MSELRTQLSYEQMIAQQKAEAEERQRRLIAEAERQRAELRAVLAPLAGQVAARQCAQRERETLIAARKLHEVEMVFPGATGLDISQFLEHQASQGHRNATTFMPAPKPVTPAPKVDLRPPAPEPKWTLLNRKRAETETTPTTDLEIVEPASQEDEWYLRGYVVGSTDGRDWVTGLDTPNLAIVFTDGTVGQVASQLDRNGTRLVPVTTEYPLPLEISDDGTPRTPVLGAYTPVEHNLFGDDTAVAGAAFMAPSQANLLLLGLNNGRNAINQ